MLIKLCVCLCWGGGGVARRPDSRTDLFTGAVAIVPEAGISDVNIHKVELVLVQVAVIM